MSPEYPAPLNVEDSEFCAVLEAITGWVPQDFPYYGFRQRFILGVGQ